MRTARLTTALATSGSLLLMAAAGTASAQVNDLSEPDLGQFGHSAISAPAAPKGSAVAAPLSDRPSVDEPKLQTTVVAPAPSAPKSPPLKPEISASAVGLTIGLDASKVSYHQKVVASGRATQSPQGNDVLVQQYRADSWSNLGEANITDTGSWALSFTAESSGPVRATMASASSMLADLDVKPRVTVHETRAAVLTKAKLEVSVAPASYAARARLVIKPRDGTRFSKSAKVARGSLSARIPLNFLGKAAVVVRLPQDLGLEASSATGNITSVAPKLSRGDRSAAVKPLLKRLKGLGFHTPKHTNRITKKVGDVILAFRKSQSLKRTKSMGRSTWREVLAAKPVKARYPKPGTHIEVDKKQQLMMVVRGGNVIGTMHVSSGLTGNTPEGSFRVFQRGGSPLYRFMAFLGNYGLHGYLSVPAYPASHGCVRIPMWAADWAWFKTQMGTEVIVYR